MGLSVIVHYFLMPKFLSIGMHPVVCYYMYSYMPLYHEG